MSFFYSLLTIIYSGCSSRERSASFGKSERSWLTTSLLFQLETPSSFNTLRSPICRSSDLGSDTMLSELSRWEERLMSLPTTSDLRRVNARSLNLSRARSRSRALFKVWIDGSGHRLIDNEFSFLLQLLISDYSSRFWLNLEEELSLINESSLLMTTREPWDTYSFNGISLSNRSGSLIRPVTIGLAKFGKFERLVLWDSTTSAGFGIG